MTISNYKLINKNTLIAAFDLALSNGICIYGAMLHEKGDSRWVMFPGKPFTKADGGVGYTKLIDIPDRAIKDKFDAQVMQALEEGGFLEIDPTGGRSSV